MENCLHKENFNARMKVLKVTNLIMNISQKNFLRCFVGMIFFLLKKALFYFVYHSNPIFFGPT